MDKPLKTLTIKKKIMGAICGVSKGKYLKPILLINSGLSFIDENYETISISESKKLACQNPKHWQLGNGTQNGQKLYYPFKDMYYQKWHLTEEELTR